MERASEFGRHDDQGGTIFGWYPAKPGEAPLVDARVAWLRHTIYDPHPDTASCGHRPMNQRRRGRRADPEAAA
jgi:hypothetical protein